MFLRDLPFAFYVQFFGISVCVSFLITTQKLRAGEGVFSCNEKSMTSFIHIHAFNIKEEITTFGKCKMDKYRSYTAYDGTIVQYSIS